jgi:hypothetical protein
VTIFTQAPNVNRRAYRFGLDSLSSGSGIDAAGEESAISNPIASILRYGEQREARRGEIVFGKKTYRKEPDSPLIEPGEANEKFGIKGQLGFDKPIREKEARLLNEWATERLERENILRRSDKTLVAGAGRLGAGLLAQALDPLNIATSFIPVVGQVRYARWLSQAGGALGRAGVRAGVGAAEGAVGAALVEPIIYAQARNERRPYDLWDSMTNVVFGAAIGGGLHTAGGAVLDRLAARRSRARTSGERLVSDIGTDRHAAALQGAVAALAEDRPVRVAEPVLASLDPEKLPAHLESMITKVPRRTTQKSRSLYYYIKQFGGVKDDGGDLAAMNVGKSRIGLVNKSGRSIDEIGEAMFQDGFDVRSDSNPDTWDVDKVKELIRQEIAGEKVYALGEEMTAAEDRLIRDAGMAADKERTVALTANRAAKDLLGRDLDAAELKNIFNKHFAEGYDSIEDAVTDTLESAIIRDVEVVEGGLAGQNYDESFPFEIDYARPVGSEGRGPESEPRSAGGSSRQDGTSGATSASDRSNQVGRIHGPDEVEQGRIDAIDREYSPRIEADNSIESQIKEAEASLAQIEPLIREGDEAELKAANELTSQATREAKAYEVMASCYLRRA